MLCYGCSGACAKKYDIALFALSALWMVKVQKVQIVQSKKNDVRHICAARQKSSKFG